MVKHHLTDNLGQKQESNFIPESDFCRALTKREVIDSIAGVSQNVTHPILRAQGVDRSGRSVVFYARGMSPGRKETRWRLALPSFLQKGVMIMTDYEIIAIILMVITLAFSIHNGNHK